MSERRYDRCGEDKLDQHHGCGSEQQSRRPERPRTGQQQVEGETNDDGRKAEERVGQNHQQASAREQIHGERGAEKYSRHCCQRRGREADAERETDDLPERRGVENLPKSCSGHRPPKPCSARTSKGSSATLCRTGNGVGEHSAPQILKTKRLWVYRMISAPARSAGSRIAEASGRFPGAASPRRCAVGRGCWERPPRVRGDLLMPGRARGGAPRDVHGLWQNRRQRGVSSRFLLWRTRIRFAWFS